MKSLDRTGSSSTSHGNPADPDLQLSWLLRKQVKSSRVAFLVLVFETTVLKLSLALDMGIQEQGEVGDNLPV